MACLGMERFPTQPVEDPLDSPTHYPLKPREKSPFSTASTLVVMTFLLVTIPLTYSGHSATKLIEITQNRAAPRPALSMDFAFNPICVVDDAHTFDTPIFDQKFYFRNRVCVGDSIANHTANTRDYALMEPCQPRPAPFATRLHRQFCKTAGGSDLCYRDIASWASDLLTRFISGIEGTYAWRVISTICVVPSVFLVLVYTFSTLIFQYPAQPSAVLYALFGEGSYHLRGQPFGALHRLLVLSTVAFIVYEICFRFSQLPLFLRRVLRMTSVKTALPSDLELQVDHTTGAVKGAASIDYTPTWAYYPTLKRTSYWFAWHWKPLWHTHVDLTYENVNLQPVAGNLVSQAIKSKVSAAVPQNPLEMATPLSTMYACKDPPKGLAIIHASPPGSIDLGAYPFATFSRISNDGKTYGVTAAHVFKNLTVYAAAGHKTMVRVGSRGNTRDFPLDLQSLEVEYFSDVDDLDVVIFNVPDSIWSLTGLKAVKVSGNVRPNAPISVYTPMADSTWKKAIGVTTDTFSLFRVCHTASTAPGASGSLVMCGSFAVLLHCRANQKKRNNVGTILKIFFPKVVLEYYTNDKYFQEREEDYDDDRDPKDEYDEYEDIDWDDDDDDWLTYAVIGGKAGHREFHASTRRTYTVAEKEQNWLDARGMGDWQQYGHECSTPEPISKPVLTPAFESLHRDHKEATTTTVHYHSPDVESLLWGSQFPEWRQPEKVPIHSDPSEPVPTAETEAHSPLESDEHKDPGVIPLNGPAASSSQAKAAPLPGKKAGLKPSKSCSEATGGNSEPPQIITKSSAVPSAASPLAGGKKRKPRRRKRKPKSKDSPSGTKPTVPAVQLGHHSMLKQPSESMETSLPPKSSAPLSTNSSPSTPKHGPRQVSETQMAIQLAKMGLTPEMLMKLAALTKPSSENAASIS